ncbi:FeoB-associated Cys-rich membrane protein [Marinicrinis sediminis]|uniref:FeoB-associated Cys-rich membrane protein n=1 Tax=Marinicrinis sediminis TaxID=1652465 RepID=A0ABW5RC52_9BACL
MLSGLIGGLIIGYAGWMLTRFIRKSRKGKCAACALQPSCVQQHRCEGKPLEQQRHSYECHSPSKEKPVNGL